MKLGSLIGQAKKVVDKRGGTDALKQDLQELQTIAKGKGTLQEKAKKAGAALKEPGTTGTSPDTVSGTPSPTATETTPEPKDPTPGAPGPGTAST